MSNDEINKYCLDNPFTKSVIEIHDNETRDIEKRDGFKLGQNNYHLLSTSEKYTARIFHLLCDLTKTMEQIQFIEIFLRRYPNKKFYWDNNIDQLTYIQYHIEVLTHKVHTILEIMKLLINEVYSLGLSAKDCSWKNLCSKIDKDTEPMKIVNKYFECFKNTIEDRHLNSHSGIFLDEEKDHINLYTGHGLYKMYNQLGIEVDNEFIINHPPFVIDMEIKEYKTKKIQHVSNVKYSIYELVRNFLTSLITMYSDNVNNLRNS